eukprot:CAMPEP_0202732544 /NCGR_PEP_ID=MMETSP1385-20130828/187712_1 /ASSEMBLY_ACC=CAM_ASM_000861 /TAXON_ID=933848 /ORGANISM="Elphidium margaritaceum" /LENGTH=397 /DNA_ID=CAMNT_0049398863 /DNA_START=813 /DNA_END=2004 /DNA_ORIENTATION=+
MVQSPCSLMRPSRIKNTNRRRSRFSEILGVKSFANKPKPKPRRARAASLNEKDPDPQSPSSMQMPPISYYKAIPNEKAETKSEEHLTTETRVQVYGAGPSVGDEAQKRKSNPNLLVIVEEPEESPAIDGGDEAQKRKSNPSLFVIVEEPEESPAIDVIPQPNAVYVQKQLQLQVKANSLPPQQSRSGMKQLEMSMRSKSNPVQKTEKQKPMSADVSVAFDDLKEEEEEEIAFQRNLQISFGKDIAFTLITDQTVAAGPNEVPTLNGMLFGKDIAFTLITDQTVAAGPNEVPTLNGMLYAPAPTSLRNSRMQSVPTDLNQRINDDDDDAVDDDEDVSKFPKLTLETASHNSLPLSPTTPMKRKTDAVDTGGGKNLSPYGQCLTTELTSEPAGSDRITW